MSISRYYIATNNEKGFEEITETEFNKLFGIGEARKFSAKVYRGYITIEEVPEELRETVQTIVNNRITRFGAYENRNIPDSEALNIITGGEGV